MVGSQSEILPKGTVLDNESIFAIAAKSLKGLGPVLALVLATHVPTAHAQVQRSTTNPSFETPRIGDPEGTGVCQGYIYANRVPGWQTTDVLLTSPTADFDNPNGCNNNPEPAPAGGTRVFEFYTTGVADNQTGLTMAAAAGRNFVELNAQTASRLYQNLCMIPGETVTYSFNHLGRRNATVVDTARMQIGGGTALGSGTTVVTVATANDGDPRLIVSPLGLSLDAASALGPSAGGAGRNWATYSGTFQVPAGLSGSQQIAFEAVCSANGTGVGAICSTTNPSSGNFLDNIRISLNPVIEFASATYSSLESNAAPPQVQLRVAGQVPVGGVPVSVTVRAGGTAALGGDYSVNGGSASSFTFTIPAGDYGTGALVSVGIPVALVNDTLVEGNESFILDIAAGSGYVSGSTTTCGGTPTTAVTYTIQDNDGTLIITKDAVPNDAQDFAFTTTGSGLSAFSLDDDADPTLPNSRTFTLNTGAYTVTETAATGWNLTGLACTDPDNGSTVTLASRIANIDLDIGETITCTFTNTRKTAQVALAKTWNGAVLNDTANLSASGAATTPSLASVANSATETDTGAPVAVNTGVALTLSETLGGSNVGAYNASVWGCTGTSGLSGNVLTVGESDTNIVCTITNRRLQADLSITKTNTPGVNGEVDQGNDTVTSGTTTTYTVTVTNNGPDAANGAMVSDSPTVAGLTGCAVLSATASNGAVAPASPGALLTGGVSIPTFPSGGQVVFQVRCTVT